MTGVELDEGPMSHEGAYWVTRIIRNRCDYIVVETFADASRQKMVRSDRTVADDHSIIDDVKLM